jgi:hypothetical protein
MTSFFHPFADKDRGETTNLLAMLILLLIGSAFAPPPALAGEVYDVYKGMVVRAKVSRFREGDTVIYHNLQGDKKTFRLGGFLGEGEHGRVFVLSGSNPPEAIKFSKEDDSHFSEHEIQSFRALKQQGLSHAKVREYDTDFYIIKDQVQGQPLDSLEEALLKLPRAERTRQIKNLDLAITSFQQALRKGPYGFADLHAGNVLFDGKALHVVDVGGMNTDPEWTANAFRSNLKVWHYLDSALRLAHEDPKWLELYDDFQDALWKPFLDSEKPSAHDLRESFRLGHPVPLTIQEQSVMAAVREASSPQFQEKIEPILKSILNRGQIEGPYVQALTNLFLNRISSPSELIDFAKVYSGHFSEKSAPTRTFFRKFADNAAWGDVLHVYQQVPSEFKRPMIIASADAAKTPEELVRAFNLPLSSSDVADPEYERLALMQDRFSRFEQFGLGHGSKPSLYFRDQIAPGTSPVAKRAYAKLYSKLTRNAISESKSAQEVFHCLEDSPARLTPEVREQLLELLTQRKAQFDALKISARDWQRQVEKMASQKPFSECFLNRITDVFKLGAGK